MQRIHYQEQRAFFYPNDGFLADVCNANIRSEMRGLGTVRCLVKDNTGCSCLLELRDAFWDAILFEESIVKELIVGQGGNDPVQ